MPIYASQFRRYDLTLKLVKEKIFYFNCQEIMDEEKEIKTRTNTEVDTEARGRTTNTRTHRILKQHLHCVIYKTRT